MRAKKSKIDRTNTNQAYWEKILTQEGFSMTRGSLREGEDEGQRNAVLEYFESVELPAVKEEELPKGFSTSDE